MRSPDPHPFLSARAGSASDVADVLIMGLPFDGGVSFRGGAAQGPSGIRLFSESLETYSPRARADLSDLSIVDVGDLEEGELPGEVLGAAWSEGRRPLLVSLGGDHSVTPRLVRAVAARSRGLVVVGFDAHLDMRERYDGDHACTFRRIADGGVPTFVMGPRSGTRDEWQDAETVLDFASPSLILPHVVVPRVEESEVYLTVDIDVIDPSGAPGTGNPEAGGPSFLQLLEAIEALKWMNVVAVDVVEVSPPLDPSGITQAAGAMLVRELVLRFA